MMARHRTSRLVVIVSLSSAALGLRVLAATITPISPAPEGSIAVPLNTSSNAQTKAGQLIVEGITTVNGGLTLGRASGTSQICWNGDCRASWDDVARITGYLELDPTTENVGAFSLQGTAGVSDPPGAINVEAGQPLAGLPTFGVQGIAEGNTGPDLTAKSYGLVGQATVNRSGHHAIYASTGAFSNAWAGYFIGNVGIGGTAENGTFDLVIGGGSAVNNNIGELCLTGDCRSAWPIPTGAGVWNVGTVSGRNYVRPNVTTRSMAVGGSGATAPFNVSVASTAGVPTDASLTVTGPAKFERYVVGTPTNLTIGQTCGDGVCNNGENDIFGSGNYCPVDCDNTAPDYTGWFDDVVVQPCQRGVQCPVVQHYLYIRLYTPSNIDVAGVRIIIRTDRYPTSPLDNGFPGMGVTNIGAGPEQQVNHYPACNSSVTYFVGAFTYDRGGNFAPGALFVPVCTNTPPNS